MRIQDTPEFAAFVEKNRQAMKDDRLNRLQKHVDNVHGEFLSFLEEIIKHRDKLPELIGRRAEGLVGLINTSLGTSE